MDWNGWGEVYSKNEQTPIDRFKNKSRLLKAFGPMSVKMYNSFDGLKPAQQIQKMLAINPADFSKMITFMLDQKIIQSKSSISNSSSVISKTVASEISSDALNHDQRLNMTASEKKIHDKYGEIGLKVYKAIDGHKNAEQILRETGISETKLVEMLEFMNTNKIIKLERPKKPATPSINRHSITSQGQRPSISSRRRRPTSKQGAKKSSSDDGLGFKPMVESESFKATDLADEAEADDIVPVDVPVIPSNISIIKKLKTKFLVTFKFGKVGNELLSHVNGAKDFVQLSLETGLSLMDLDIILGELGKANLITFKQLTRAEIKHKYGEDGLSVYKKYGRDGILIYQLIGRTSSLKDIIRMSKLETDRAVDIIMFVHRMLGLDIPLDRDMIYRYIKK